MLYPHASGANPLNKSKNVPPRSISPVRLSSSKKCHASCTEAGSVFRLKNALVVGRTRWLVKSVRKQEIKNKKKEIKRKKKIKK
jgi:hypothetical protein